jgi:hypothetical protein
MSEPVPPRSHSLWKWYFAVVIALTLLATAALWWFNQSIQLTRAQFNAERRRWEEKRPPAYRFSYFRVDDDSSTGVLYKVEVAGARVTRAEAFDVEVRERRDIEAKGEGRTLSPAKAQLHSMDELFRLLDGLLEEDARQERRVYVRARFHPDHGALLEFVHRVMHGQQRVQVSVVSFKS